MADPITTFYADNPWEAVDKNQRHWYYPEVAFMYRRDGVFSRFLPWTWSLRNVGAKEATVTRLLPPHATGNPVDLRQMWAEASHVDSLAVTVTFEHYMGKVAYHKYDDVVTYWRMNRRRGLLRIMRQALGQHMVDTLDIIARNAYIKGALDSGFVTWAGVATGFDNLAVTDLFDPDYADDVWLRLFESGVANGIGVSGATGIIYAITTPGVIYDIRKQLKAANASDAWIPIPKEQMVSRYEVGQYGNVRFLQSNRALLRNSGAIIYRASVVQPINAGDGAPDPNTTRVDGAYKVGQSGAVHYIQLAALDDVGVLGTDLKVNDVVTIHVSKLPSTGSPYGVADGVDFRDGRNHHRRVVSIDATNRRIVLDRPIMIDMNTDLGGGVYAYVTKARNVHATLFIGDYGGIVGAVGQPPQFHEPPVIDDAMAMHRYSWDAYLGANLFAPEKFEVVFSAGSTRVKGPVVVQ